MYNLPLPRFDIVQYSNLSSQSLDSEQFRCDLFPGSVDNLHKNHKLKMFFMEICGLKWREWDVSYRTRSCKPPGVA